MYFDIKRRCIKTQRAASIFGFGHHRPVDPATCTGDVDARDHARSRASGYHRLRCDFE